MVMEWRQIYTYRNSCQTSFIILHLLKEMEIQMDSQYQLIIEFLCHKYCCLFCYVILDKWLSLFTVELNYY